MEKEKSLLDGREEGDADRAYCHALAERAVARAALHLGCESMTGEAVDALAGVLLAYLERVGGALSTGTEASGRSSQHCHVLDAVRAVQVCTPPAGRLRQAAGEAVADDEQQHPAAHHHHHHQQQQQTWKDLAAFCFGPNWLARESVRRRMSIGAASPQIQEVGRGGKVGPSAAATAEEQLALTGWDAPFPVEVPPFPASRLTQWHEKLNPSLPKPETADKSEAAEEEEGEDPFSRAFGEWLGATLSQTDRKRKAEETENEEEEPAKKRVRLAAGTAAVVAAAEKEEEEKGEEEDEANEKPSPERRGRHPLYVPVFYPPFPATTEEGRRTVAAATEETATTTTDPTLKVRTALVQLGEQDPYAYWGQTTTGGVEEAVVVPGKVSTEKSATTIRPLDRASLSRISRILEGSMDVGVS
jgi:hypothetical protein